MHLIKKNEINIYDIPIALIAQQYLDYLSVMKELNLAVAGEFLVMAATLLHIKSRMLLPADEVAVDEEEGPDPREELVRRLLEYKQFKEAASSHPPARPRTSATSYRPIDAVRQWVYTPTLLNGVPVPVIMTVTVNFKLS